MPIVALNVAEVADANGDATFQFPDVPLGQLWSGTTAIPNADVFCTATVTASGLLLGSMQGPASYGPWTVDHSQRLTISATGLVAGTQYIAVWHADTMGKEFSTYPAVSGTANLPVNPTPTPAALPMAASIANEELALLEEIAASMKQLVRIFT